MRKLNRLISGGSWINFFVIFLSLVGIYIAALVFKFAQNDDYYYFAYDNRSLFADYHPQKDFFNLVGRQLYNVVHAFFALLIRTIPDLSIIRMIEIVILAISGSFLVKFFEKFNVARHHAIIYIVLLLLLPGFQAGIIWATMAPFAFALLLAVCSGIYAQRAVEAYADGHQEWSSIFKSMALIMAALFIYQPWAMFYLLPFAIVLLFNRFNAPAEYIRMFWIYGAIFVSALLSYYIFQHYIYLPYKFLTHPELRALSETFGKFRFELNEHIGSRIFVLLHNAGPQLLDLWDIYDKGWGAAISLGVLGTFTFINVSQWLSRGRVNLVQIRNMLFVAIGVAAALLASLSPLIMAAGGHTGFRTVLPATAIVLMVVFRGLYWIQGRLEASLLVEGNKSYRSRLAEFFMPGLILLVVSYSAYGNVYASAYNNVIELEYLRSKIIERASQDPFIWHIRVVLNNKDVSYLNLQTLGDGEFNYNSSSGWPNIPWMIRSILLSSADSPQSVRIDAVGMEKSPPQYHPGFLVVSVVEPDKANYACTKGELCIDMNERSTPHNNWWIH